MTNLSMITLGAGASF